MWSPAAVLVCVMNLIGPTSKFPPIELIESPPIYVSRNAEAFVLRDPDRIFLITSAGDFQEARRMRGQCGNIGPIRKIASILVHEQWHLTHGGDERGAYYAQLNALTLWGAGPGTATYHSVQKSMLTVLKAQKRDSKIRIAIAETEPPAVQTGSGLSGPAALANRVETAVRPDPSPLP